MADWPTEYDDLLKKAQVTYFEEETKKKSKKMEFGDWFWDRLMMPYNNPFKKLDWCWAAFDLLWCMGTGFTFFISIFVFLVDLFTSTSMGWYGWYSAFLFWFLIPLLISVGSNHFLAAREKRLERKERLKKDEELQPVRLLPRFLSDRLQQEKEMTIGQDSNFGRFYQKLMVVQGRANCLRERFMTRSRNRRDVAYLTDALKRVDELIKKIDVDVGKMRRYRAKVEAFFAECEERVRLTTEPLEDAALLDELADLEVETDDLHLKVETEIMRTTILLAEKIGGLKLQLDRVPSGAALPAAKARDAAIAYESLKELVGEFVKVEVPDFQIKSVEEEVHS